MFIRFIAHSGIYVEDGGHSVLIDPWFHGSSVKKPLVESIAGNHRTIDFQIPPTQEKIGDYSPDAILVSHFHAHHSSKSDILELVHQEKKVKFIYPADIDVEGVDDAFSLFENVSPIPFNDKDSVKVGNILIKGMFNTVPGHMTWYIKSDTGSLLHIADARVSKQRNTRTPDPLWKQFIPLKPDVVFLSAGGNRLRNTDQKRGNYISDGTIFTPGEAANFLGEVKPKGAAVMGCYNRSIWSTLREYVLPSVFIEDEFYWALSWTAPETRCLFLRPGITIGIGDEKLLSKTDIFIKGK